jgi:acyl dehydratase
VANDDETRGETRGESHGDEAPGAAVREVVGVVGATTTLTRSLSEADLALFALVMGAADLATDARLEAEPSYQRVAPPALLAALLTTSAAQHSERPPLARFISGQVRFIEPAYAEETVRASATVTGIDDATGALHINARCETEDGRSLAEADFLMQRD